MSAEIRRIASQADLSDESSMCDALEAINKIVAEGTNNDLALWLSCVSLDDPSSMYDALVHLASQ